MADVLDPVLVDVADADLVALLEVEEAGGVAHHLHGHAPVLLALHRHVVIHQHREALVLVLVQVGHLAPHQSIDWEISTSVLQIPSLDTQSFILSGFYIFERFSSPCLNISIFT